MQWCGVITAAILIIVVVCLITTSFSYLNYYEVRCPLPSAAPVHAKKISSCMHPFA